MEVKRILDVADQHLAGNRYFCGKQFTIADIANFAWLHYLVRGDAYGGAKFLDVASYANVGRWVDELRAREGVRRGMTINRAGMAGFTPERHSAADIDAVLGT